MQRDYRTLHLSFTALALGLAVFASCSRSKLSDGREQADKAGPKASDSENSGGETDTDDEKAAEPAMVSGSFLACAYDTAADASDTAITCAWTSSKDRPEAKDVNWKAVGADGKPASGVTVTPSSEEPSAKLTGDASDLNKATIVAEGRGSASSISFKLVDVPHDCGSPYKRFVQANGNCQNARNLFRKSRISAFDFIYDVDRSLAPDWRLDTQAFAIFDLAAGEDCKGPLGFQIVHQMTGPTGLHMFATCPELPAAAVAGFKVTGKTFMGASPLAFGAQPLHHFVLPTTGAHFYTLTPESDSLGGWVEVPWHVYVLPPE